MRQHSKILEIDLYEAARTYTAPEPLGGFVAMVLLEKLGLDKTGFRVFSHTLSKIST